MDDPQLSSRNLSDAAQRIGAEFLWNTEVASFTYDITETAVMGVVLTGWGLGSPSWPSSSAGEPGLRLAHPAVVASCCFFLGHGRICWDNPTSLKADQKQAP
jgi:hypothetical protein